MTVKEYLKAHKGKCLAKRSFDLIPCTHVVTWRIPKRIFEKSGRPYDPEQRVNGYGSKQEAEARAKSLARQGAACVRVIAL